MNASEPAAGADATESAPPPLPDPVVGLEMSGDIGAEIAALAVQSGEVQRRTSQDIRDALEDYVESQQNQQIEAMRAKAGDMFVSAVVEGVGTAASGACTFTGAFLCESTKTKLSGVGTLALGGAKVGSAFYSQSVGNDDADAAAHANARDHAKRAIDDTNDASKGAGEYINSAIEFYREYVSAQGQTMNAALHRA